MDNALKTVVLASIVIVGSIEVAKEIKKLKNNWEEYKQAKAERIKAKQDFIDAHGQELYDELFGKRA